MPRQVTGTILQPDGSAVSGTIDLTAKYNTQGAVGIARQSSMSIVVATDGSYDDLVEFGTYYVTWSPTGGSSRMIGVAVIASGAATDIFTLIG